MNELRPASEFFSAGNPFCTRFIRPGAISYRFAAEDSGQSTEQKIICMANTIAETPRSVIVGPHGSGKSTLLHSLWPHLEKRFRSLERLQLHAPEPSDSATLLGRSWSHFVLVHKAQLRLWRQNRTQNQGRPSCLVIDGFEQLSLMQRWQVVWVARCINQSLLVTAHGPMRWFDRVHQSDSTPSMILQLTDDLLKRAPESTRSLIGGYLAESELSQVRDVREFWFRLYDVVADASGATKSSKYAGAANR
jgi:hypothetical protein